VDWLFAQFVRERKQAIRAYRQFVMKGQGLPRPLGHVKKIVGQNWGQSYLIILCGCVVNSNIPTFPAIPSHEQGVIALHKVPPALFGKNIFGHVGDQTYIDRKEWIQNRMGLLCLDCPNNRLFPALRGMQVKG